MRRLPSVALPRRGGHAAGIRGQLLLQGQMWLGMQVASLPWRNTGLDDMWRYCTVVYSRLSVVVSAGSNTALPLQPSTGYHSCSADRQPGAQEPWQTAPVPITEPWPLLTSDLQPWKRKTPPCFLQQQGDTCSLGAGEAIGQHPLGRIVAIPIFDSSKSSTHLLTGAAQSRKGSLASAASFACITGAILEEKTLLWLLLPTLIMAGLVFLPLIFVTQKDWSRHCYSWNHQAIHLLFRWVETDILFSYT